MWHELRPNHLVRAHGDTIWSVWYAAAHGRWYISRDGAAPPIGIAKTRDLAVVVAEELAKAWASKRPARKA